ncbi:MAG TPA: hypothetical protein VN612_01320 [Acidobacteriaceae bacterium]|nr:hypothetical protein [Acidobacteriaceae bacterium]
MKVLCAVGLIAASIAVPAQIQAIHESAPPPNPALQHAPDGGTRFTIQSIDIAPLENAPFTARVDTEWTRILPDGTAAITKNHRTVARDSTGRVFQERRYFTPTGDQDLPQLSALEYADPGRHELLTCNPQRKICYESQYLRPVLYKMPAGITGLAVCGCASRPGTGIRIEREALDRQTIENLDAIGSREITTLPAGTFGNASPQPIVKEFWYSPQLGINLVTKRFDPRAGSENFVVNHVSLNEPDPRLFEPPADYTIVREQVVRPAIPPTN